MIIKNEITFKSSHYTGSTGIRIPHSHSYSNDNALKFSSNEEKKGTDHSRNLGERA